MSKYLSYHQGDELAWGFGNYFLSKEDIPLSVLRKDYFQEIDTLTYKGKYGLIGENLSPKEKGDNCCVFPDWKDNDVKIVEIIKPEYREIIIPSGYKYAIIHPSWKTKIVCVNIHYLTGKNRKFIFSSNTELMSRYIPVIVVSSIDDYVCIDSAWKNIVRIIELK